LASICLSAIRWLSFLFYRIGGRDCETWLRLPLDFHLLEKFSLARLKVTFARRAAATWPAIVALNDNGKGVICKQYRSAMHCTVLPDVRLGSKVSFH
jgi:hypothetical protein